MARDDRVCLEKLRTYHRELNWDIQEERCQFIRRIMPVIRHRLNPCLDLLDVFQPHEIELLLMDSMDCMHGNKIHYERVQFIEYVSRTGYKPEVGELGEDGKPSKFRATPLHRAARRTFDVYSLAFLQRVKIFTFLFEIYDRFDVNYTDEAGLTHLHVACRSGCSRAVDKFLELGQDPDCPLPETGDSPLHLSVLHEHTSAVKSLLRHGADPNLRNDDDSTPLHVVSKKYTDPDDLAKMLFEMCHDRFKPLRVDALDRWGRTPLQLAVASLAPDTLKVLLDQGADVSNFEFPTEDYFAADVPEGRNSGHFKLKLGAKALLVIERLRRSGYDLDRSDASQFMKLLVEHEWLDTSMRLDGPWYDDAGFAQFAKDTIVGDPGLPLYELLQLRPEEAAMRVTYADYAELARSRRLYSDLFSEELHEACNWHLCDIMSRKFFRRLATDAYLDLTQGRLPILCCEMIVDRLSTNRDLYELYLAAESLNS